MAITLLADIDAIETNVQVTDPDFATRRFPFPALIEGELVSVRGGAFVSVDNDGTYHYGIERGVEGSTPASHTAGTELDPSVPAVQGSTGAIELAPSFNDAHSFQTVAADVNLGVNAGSTGTDPKFLAGVMGNAIGADLTKAGAYIAGVIGADSVTGTQSTDYQKGGLLGLVMDGVSAADGAVVAVLDGSDPSSVTRATAAFAARINNNNAGSGFDYGVDLKGPANANYTGGGVALAFANGLLRSPNDVVILEGADVPTDGTTGDNFAGPGSLFIDYTHGEAYIQTGLITNPVWKKLTHAA